MIFKIVIIGIFVTIAAMFFLQVIDPNLSSTTIGTTDTSGTVTIGITGEVSQPGEYVLNSNPTMEDLIAAAGGLTTNADDRCFYLEASLEANNSYYIPPKYDNSNVCSEDPISKVNINEADSDELITLSGFGSTIAGNLINYRDENGLFYTIEAIMNVTGIGNSKFNLCKDYIYLHD